MASITALLAYGAQQTKAKKKTKKAKNKYQVSYTSSSSTAAETELSSNSTGTPLQTKPRDVKALRNYEEAIRRRDFQQVLWAIANGDVAADHETANGENAILAAVASKNADVLRMLIIRYEKVRIRQL